MQRRSRWPAVAMLAALAACAKPRPVEPIAATAPAPAHAYSTAIASTGIGPLGGKTPNDRDAIAALLPGLDVHMGMQVSDSHEVHEYTIAQAGRRVLFVVMDTYRTGPDKMFRIDVLDPMFATTTGIGVGATIGALAAKHPDLACKFARYDPDADIYRVDRRLYCETPALPNVTFDLDPEGYRAAPGPVAPGTLAAWKIHRIGWVNPAK